MTIDIEAAFHAEVASELHDPVHRMVYAYRLLEQGDVFGELIPLSEEIRKMISRERKVFYELLANAWEWGDTISSLAGLAWLKAARIVDYKIDEYNSSRGDWLWGWIGDWDERPTKEVI